MHFQRNVKSLDVQNMLYVKAGQLIRSDSLVHSVMQIAKRDHWDALLTQ